MCILKTFCLLRKRLCELMNDILSLSSDKNYPISDKGIWNQSYKKCTGKLLYQEYTIFIKQIPSWMLYMLMCHDVVYIVVLFML